MRQQSASDGLVFFALVLAACAAVGSIPRGGPPMGDKLVNVLLPQLQALMPTESADPESPNLFVSP